MVDTDDKVLVGGIRGNARSISLGITIFRSENRLRSQLVTKLFITFDRGAVVAVFTIRIEAISAEADTRVGTEPLSPAITDGIVGHPAEIFFAATGRCNAIRVFRFKLVGDKVTAQESHPLTETVANRCIEPRLAESIVCKRFRRVKIVNQSELAVDIPCGLRSKTDERHPSIWVEGQRRVRSCGCGTTRTHIVVINGIGAKQPLDGERLLGLRAGIVQTLGSDGVIDEYG